MLQLQYIFIASLVFLLSCFSDSQSNRKTPVDQNALVTKKSVLDRQELQKLDSLSIDYQLRGFCYAFSSKKNAKASNGEAHSDNIAKPIDKDFVRNGLYLFLNDKELLNIRNKIFGHKLYLVNSTVSEQAFEAQDSRLNIVAQALDRKNNWITINYLPSSWCGNSYHTITLDPDEYWQFEVPVFKGDFKTKLRYVLQIDDKEVYSNEIFVFLNNNQFDKKRKEGHTSQNIMDPYEE